MAKRLYHFVSHIIYVLIQALAGIINDAFFFCLFFHFSDR